jgi:hypothetical protein
MSHKFRLDRAVVFSPGSNEILTAATRGKVTRLMPMEGVEYQYFVQIESDGLERRAQEHQLRPVSSNIVGS